MSKIQHTLNDLCTVA